MLAMNQSLLSAARRSARQHHVRSFRMEGCYPIFGSNSIAQQSHDCALISSPPPTTTRGYAREQKQQQQQQQQQQHHHQWNRQSLCLPLHGQFLLSQRFFHATPFSNRRAKDNGTKPVSSVSAAAAAAAAEVEKAQPPKFPTIQDAKDLAMVYREMDNQSLVMLGGLGGHAARQEILIRHIMAVDEVEYDRALLTFYKIEEANHEGMYLLGLPFQVGAATLLISGIISVPMVFHLETVEWFNELFVTADVPPPKDLETWLEVGAWSWNWMEPLLGTASFILLCMQYFRINMGHLGIKPYTHRLKNFRAQRLASLFPRYDREVLMRYSESDSIYRS